MAFTSTYLEHMTWPEAETALKQAPVVVVPIGARLKEHGLHLPLNNDWLIAEAMTAKLMTKTPILVAPTISYGYYPSFVEYAGSVNIERNTFRNTIVDIAKSFARHGAKRIYFFNTGFSTSRALEPARHDLAREGVEMLYSDMERMLRDVEASVAEQPCGSHADELETSMMMVLASSVVRWERATSDVHPRRGPGILSRDPDVATGIYSKTGAWGDPTLANPEKGKKIIDVWIQKLVAEIELFSHQNWQAPPPVSEYLQGI